MVAFWSATHQGSCHWVSSSDLQSEGSQFVLTHTLSPYAEESTMLEVTAEATNNNFYFLSENKKFYLRDIGEKQTVVFILPRILPIISGQRHVSAVPVVPDSPHVVRCQEVDQELNVTIHPPSSWSTPHSFFSLEHEIEYVVRDDGSVRIRPLTGSHVCLSWCLLWFLTVGSVPTLETTLSVHSDTEGDQQAEGSLQGLGGPLTLESVDSVEKCNPLKLSEPVTVSFCIFTFSCVLTCLQCSPVCHIQDFIMMMGLFPYLWFRKEDFYLIFIYFECIYRSSIVHYSCNDFICECTQMIC